MTVRVASMADDRRDARAAAARWGSGQVPAMPPLASGNPMAIRQEPSTRLKMLSFACKGQRYYAGQDGLPSRHETRAHQVGLAQS